MVGTPSKSKGPVSTIVPSGPRVVAFIYPKLASRILLIIGILLSFPVNPIPKGRVLPKSLSKAKTWLAISSACPLAYYQSPPFVPPYSSPDQAMNLRVLLGFNPKEWIALKASKQVITPPPSSLAPV